MEPYSAIKGEELLKHATSWMNSETPIKVKEARHKDYILHDFIFMKWNQKGKFIETESRSMVVMGWEREQGLT